MDGVEGQAASDIHGFHYGAFRAKGLAPIEVFLLCENTACMPDVLGYNVHICANVSYWKPFALWNQIVGRFYSRPRAVEALPGFAVLQAHMWRQATRQDRTLAIQL